MACSTRNGAPLVLAAFVWASAAHAQVAGSAKGPVQINPPGSYEGVKPGGNQPPPVAATPNSGANLITWPGFQMRPDGSSRVFVQSTSALTPAVSQQGKLLKIDLGEAKVSGETNQFALYTRFFNTPVVRAQLLKTGARVVLEIELRASVAPSLSSERAASGFHFLYVDFAAGQYLAQGASAAPVPAGTAPAPGPTAPSHLDDAPPAPPEPASSGVKANASIDAETPPGQGKVKANAGLKL